MSRLRLAVPSMGIKGMRDIVSSVFAKAPVFTIVDIVEGEVKEVRKEKNLVSHLKQGSGPIVAKNLRDLGVDAVVAGEMGPGARTLMELNRIKVVIVEPGIKVSDAVATAIKELKPSESD
ncbi:MAG: NifB/NifX family molybdenum-iron cluster-binding protein [Candidatus Bathyarchaeia archaeon]